MLGIKIKSLRQEMGWNQTELAQRIGVGRTTVTEYERDVIVPPIDKLEAMAHAFGIPVSDLTGNQTSESLDFGTDVRKIIGKLKTDPNYSIGGEPIQQKQRDMLVSEMEQLLRLSNYLNSLAVSAT